MVHLITYELKGYRSRQEYERLYDAIKGISGTWLHLPESKWFVETNRSAIEVRNRLQLFTPGELVFVTRVHAGEWASFNLDAAQVAWFGSRDYGSPLENALSGFAPIADPAAAVTSPFGLYFGLGGERRW